MDESTISERLACNILYTFSSHRVPPCLLPSATRKGEWIYKRRKKEKWWWEEEGAEGRNEKEKKQVSVVEIWNLLLVWKTRKVAGRTGIFRKKKEKDCFPFRRYLGKQQLREYYIYIKKKLAKKNIGMEHGCGFTRILTRTAGNGGKGGIKIGNNNKGNRWKN